jgi:hypothetical protein
MAKNKRRTETHAIFLIVELLAPLTPLTRAAQVRAACAALFEKLPCGVPVVLPRLTSASGRLLFKGGIYLVCKRPKRGNVSPGARAHGARDENAEG